FRIYFPKDSEKAERSRSDLNADRHIALSLLAVVIFAGRHSCSAVTLDKPESDTARSMENTLAADRTVLVFVRTILGFCPERRSCHVVPWRSVMGLADMRISVIRGGSSFIAVRHPTS